MRYDKMADPKSRTPEIIKPPHELAQVKRYQTPGPGPSANVFPSSRDHLELSKLDRVVADTRTYGHVKGTREFSIHENNLKVIEAAIKVLRREEH